MRPEARGKKAAGVAVVVAATAAARAAVAILAAVVRLQEAEMVTATAAGCWPGREVHVWNVVRVMEVGWAGYGPAGAVVAESGTAVAAVSVTLAKMVVVMMMMEVAEEMVMVADLATAGRAVAMATAVGVAGAVMEAA